MHAAFLVKDSGEMILEIVPVKPPEPLQEIAPSAPNSNMIWIPGYWSWSKRQQEYLWISGVWRLSPPGHQWISGYWKQVPKGWVYVPGFWIQDSSHLTFYSTPPDPLDEIITSPPNEGYFWMPGYWKWDTTTNSYVWIGGTWEPLDPQWVYVPSRFVWREQGYVFIPGYWDWPLESRGVVYAAVYVSRSLQNTYIYHPSKIIALEELIENYFNRWPDYAQLFHHDYYYNQVFWKGWGVAPFWWDWMPWWGLTWHDKWWLWWWWTHPGYPAPYWITSTVAKKMPPPSQTVLEFMQGINPPPVVTPQGTVGQRIFYNALTKVMGVPYPFLPTDPQLVQEIQTVAQPPLPPSSLYLRPTGTLPEEKLPKPHFGPSPKMTAPQTPKVQSPPKPNISESQRLENAKVLRKIPSPKIPLLGNPVGAESETLVLDFPLESQVALPKYYPYFQDQGIPDSGDSASTNPPQPYLNPDDPPAAPYSPDSSYDLQQPFQLPTQGQIPQGSPTYPLELQNRGDLMLHPQPQRNPP